ncbi:MAG: hypothetical protein LBN06_03490 [Prevotellaceae bacterium]|jgi:hypothetical protein|nr:hypothetical protein [Prevotellaceae bacterium]
MKVLFIIPGSGDSFYCGNCFRDNLQATALRKAGHEVTVMPLYLPLTQPSFRADTPLFFPATTYYVEQKFFGRRSMPRPAPYAAEARRLAAERYHPQAMATRLESIYTNIKRNSS